MAQAKFDINEIKRVCKYAEENKTKMYLVKDTGVYIMSSAKEGNPAENNLVVYAEGFNPKTDDYYDLARAEFGGDDFGEELPIVDWLSTLLEDKPRARKFILDVKQDSIGLKL